MTKPVPAPFRCGCCSACSHPSNTVVRGTETQALVAQLDAVVGRLFLVFPPLPHNGPSLRTEAFDRNRKGLRALVMSLSLVAKLLSFLRDTEFYFYSQKEHTIARHELK